MLAFMSHGEFILGLISDTHGLLRAEAIAALQGSHAILHAGDVGQREILEALQKIAPVHAVRGNTDSGTFGESLPQTLALEFAGVSMYMLHNLRELDLKPQAAGFQIVVSGHTHKPLAELKDEVLFVNPGAAGPRRFELPVTVAKINLTARPLQAEFLHLHVK